MQPQILIKGLSSGYEIEHLARVFFPGAVLRKEPGTKGTLVYARASKERLVVGCRLGGGACIAREANGSKSKKELVHRLSTLLYRLLCAQTGLRPPWGMLTGVRPVRLYRRLLPQAKNYANPLQAQFDVSDEKHRLLREIHKRQAPVLEKSSPLAFSLYVSIPFCPSRCSYCSFVSQTVGRQLGLIDSYLDALNNELLATAEAAAASGLVLETVYIGGGTPTSLSVGQLERLLGSIHRHFDMARLKEFTLEAGRPDCTDSAKLHLMKKLGVTRISINPQSFNPQVLDTIGRRHTEEDIYRCFGDARRAGHTGINMDLIAGLPGDTVESFLSGLTKAFRLAPESITLHTLTLKRGADLKGQAHPREWEGALAGRMLEEAYPRLFEVGYGPYYLYRQKGTPGNLENTGWARPGREGLYNILMMEEICSVLSVGAAATTKLVVGAGYVIERSYNPKYPADYIQNIDNIIARKKGVTQFYARHLDS